MKQNTSTNTKSASQRPPASSRPPASQPPATAFALPELKTFKQLRDTLARGGLPAFDQRTPLDDARIAAFRTVTDLMRTLTEFRRRIENGEPCRLVVHEQPSSATRLQVFVEIVDGNGAGP